MKTYNDSISEIYRKYIIEIKLDKNKNFYLLWGTDMKDDDNDKILLDNKGNILIFNSMSLLLNGITNQCTFRDEENIINWSKHFSDSQPYAIYDIVEVKNTIMQTSLLLNNLSRRQANELLNFYNLMSDYAYQINSEELFSIINEKNMKLVFDYIYDLFFWNNKGHEDEIKKKIRGFKESAFVNNYKKMIQFFEQKLNVLN